MPNYGLQKFANKILALGYFIEGTPGHKFPTSNIPIMIGYSHILIPHVVTTK